MLLLLLFTDEPKACISYNEFQPPLPRVACRDIVTMRVWVPQGFSRDGKLGELREQEDIL